MSRSTRTLKINCKGNIDVYRRIKYEMNRLINKAAGETVSELGENQIEKRMSPLWIKIKKQRSNKNKNDKRGDKE